MRVAMTEYVKIDLNTERWTCHLRWCATAAALAWAQGVVPGVAASVGFAPPAPAGTLRLLTGNDFWAGADALDDAEFVLAVLPAQADPEAAIARVRALA
jgi:hypothetical protein